MLNPVQKAIVLLGVCVAVAVCVDKCSPDCTGEPAGSMVPDPMDCKQFYYCLNGEFPMDHPFPCGPGQIFDDILNKCQVGTDCTPQCPTTVPNCHFTCDATYDLVRDPSSCSQYFQCLPHGLEGPFACGSGTPYFNGENCVDDEGACCSDQCTAYCEAAMTQIADPKNCTNYYICLAPGLASEENHFPCDAGETFNIATGRCDSGASCVTLCGASTVGPTGASAITSNPSTSISAEPSTATQTSSPSNPSIFSSNPPTPSTLTPSPSATLTSSPSVTSTTMETSTTVCIDSLVCTVPGAFSKCNTCDKEFFYCDTIGQEADVYTCTGDLVFNPDPAYPFCVLPTNCPYHPPYED